MNTNSSQSDLYRLLFESSRDPYLPTVAQSLRSYTARLDPRLTGDDNFIWCLLRFHEDGSLHSIHRASDNHINSEDEFVQLLTTGHGHNFQIMVRQYGHGAALTAGDISAFNRVWQIPDHLWVTMLSSKNDNSSKLLIGAGEEQFGIMSTQSHSICLNDNHVFVPDDGMGTSRSAQPSQGVAVVFVCQQGFPKSTWSVSSMSTEKAPIHAGQSEDTPAVKKGEYGMITWLADQAFRRRCATGKDFVFLCAEALLRGSILDLSSTIHRLLGYEIAGYTRFSRYWFKARMELLVCQDTIQILPSWIEDHCSEEVDSGQAAMRMKILRQYEQKIQLQERAMNTIKHSLDIAFARTGEKMALDSINEVKFGKICNTRLTYAEAWLIPTTVTIVAIIYLPVSIASSIFGMNIQELNGQGVSIVWFVVAVFATLGALILCWLFFAFLISKRDALMETYNKRLRDRLRPYEPRSWEARLLFIDLTRQRVGFWPHRMYDTLKDLKDRSLALMGSGVKRDAEGMSGG